MVGLLVSTQASSLTDWSLFLWFSRHKDFKLVGGKVLSAFHEWVQSRIWWGIQLDLG